ncbi:peptidylprolyl isomerase [Alkalimarinus sediminis]|uniref:Peptidyl-prolyl cis-trans isomerase n=1 Tax=Alkalimarinus sediminis TaxID=1632866 RepID=A0A9E8HMA0_9ALTE|nr:peptidylprolyl isomerase [Alkalimarinus sediminis]UZW75942.1 peptidylprolyl isomerase [Alkalimarinus sediminis]
MPRYMTLIKSLMLCISLVFSSFALAAENNTAPSDVKVQIETNYGNIIVQLNSEKAPITVKNFLYYVESGFYTKTIFHRVIPGFMIQGGGFTKSMDKLPTQAPIRNEASNGLHNNRGTIAMARTNNPHSATAQFFINVANNNFLDYSQQSMGYAVFGKVVEGMDVVDKIEHVKTTKRNMHKNIPVDPVVIKGMSVVK